MAFSLFFAIVCFSAGIFLLLRDIFAKKLPTDSLSQPKLSLKTVRQNIISDNVHLSLAIFILALFLITFFLLINSPKDWSEFFEGVQVEMVGMLFDILLLVLLFNWINAKGDKKRRIERYQEELNDYRGWYDEEARHRVGGILLRLEKEGAEIDFNHLHLGKTARHLVEQALAELRAFKGSLSRAFLTHFNFEGLKLANGRFSHAHLWYCNFNDTLLLSADFTGASLMHASFQKSNLNMAKFNRANLQNADMQRAQLLKAHFELCVLNGANLSYAQLYSAKFIKSDLIGANLSHTYLQHADFTYSDLSNANLEGADIRNCKLWQANNISNIRLLGAKVESKDWYMQYIFDPKAHGTILGKFFPNQTPHKDEQGNIYYVLEDANVKIIKPSSKDEEE